MGEVYRAHDTKLNRDVAIKVLPEAFASDPERLSRFTREAQTLASLNHPNIAAIYGIEETPSTTESRSGLRALVMELVEGEDLSTQIARGPIPIAEALPIAKQIAEALEAAHEHGIVHRDLKPANIKIRSDGTVKVLDFGLAKAMDPSGASNVNLSHSPTLTGHGTQLGVIIGTAAYMSPEQAKGKVVDRRADIWAFGVVLCEMLTGERTFKGEDISDVLAAVLRQEVNWAALPKATPPRLKRLLEHCLDRDVKERLRDIGEARFEIGKILTGAPESAVSPGGAATDVPAWRRALPWAVAAFFGIAFVVALVRWAPWRETPVAEPRRLLASIGVDASLTTGLGASAILSPDGKTLVFAARQADQTRLFIRKLDQLQAVALGGTEGAESPFFSPDGRWIGFFASGKLKKVSVTGGAAVNLCNVEIGRGGTWTENDTIIFTPGGTASSRLMWVPSAGGTPSVFVALSAGALLQRWPQTLPGGKSLLYTEHSTTSGFDLANLAVAPLPSGTPKIVLRGGYYGRYVPSGHLVYMHQGTLFAVRFDLNRLETIGQAAPALEGVITNQTSFGGAQLAFSAEGTLVYVPGGSAAATAPINWMTRDGKTSVLKATKAAWAGPVFSPDGHKVALTIFGAQRPDVWAFDWARDTLTQLTFDRGDDRLPVFSPDGRRIVFASDRAKPGVFNLYWVNADGTGDVTRLTDNPGAQRPASFHPGGKFVAFDEDRPDMRSDLMILPLEGDTGRGFSPKPPAVFLGTLAEERSPMFSPDGRWIAYQSNEIGGQNDVYVRPFPGPGGQWRVSTEGGQFPRWSPPTRELLFVNPGQARVMVAPYTVVGDSFRSDHPRVWSPVGYRPLASPLMAPYDIHPDGKRLALSAAEGQSAAPQDHVVFVFNFFDYLRAILPEGK